MSCGERQSFLYIDRIANPFGVLWKITLYSNDNKQTFYLLKLLNTLFGKSIT